MSFLGAPFRDASAEALEGAGVTVNDGPRATRATQQRLGTAALEVSPDLTHRLDELVVDRERVDAMRARWPNKELEEAAAMGGLRDVNRL